MESVLLSPDPVHEMYLNADMYKYEHEIVINGHEYSQGANILQKGLAVISNNV